MSRKGPPSKPGKLFVAGSITALGVALALTAGGLVQSQPRATRAAELPAPVEAQQQVESQAQALSTPAQPAAVPAAALADAPLRDDQVQLILKALSGVAAEGLQPAEYPVRDAEALLKSNDGGERQRGQALLKKAVIAYAKAEHGWRVPEAQRSNDWGIQPAAYDAAADFNQALGQNKLAEWLAALPPPFERYRDLKTALGQYRAIAARGGWDAIPAGPALKPGMKGERVIALRKRLAAENPPGSIPTDSPVYDEQLAAIVQAAQARYGVNPDGVVAGDTLKAFNVPVEGRIAQIQVNMERWRWMPRQGWPTTRIEVNIPEQQLVVYDANKPVDDMKVVVGAPDKKTPMLISAIHSVVFNPPWNVPTSIATKELLPKGQDYLDRKGFVWVSQGGKSRLQQRPGPGNSLGRIKFDFPNAYGVYLHDTNAKTAFGRDSRSLSHGCVRVERPDELANLLLGNDSRWTPDRLDQVLADTTTVRASLPSKVPVMLLYWTAFVAPDGQMNFRDDIYGWDDDLSRLVQGGKSAI